MKNEEDNNDRSNEQITLSDQCVLPIKLHLNSASARVGLQDSTGYTFDSSSISVHIRKSRKKHVMLLMSRTKSPPKLNIDK